MNSIDEFFYETGRYGKLIHGNLPDEIIFSNPKFSASSIKSYKQYSLFISSLEKLIFCRMYGS